MKDLSHLGGSGPNGDPITFMPDVFGYVCLRYNCRSVLDVGCALGFNAVWFHNRGYDVMGVEGLPDYVKGNKLPKDRIVLHDYTEGPWVPPHEFDLAVCFPAGTLLRGTTKRIEDVVIGDTVTGLSSKKQKVTKTFHRSYDGRIVTLQVRNIPDISLTFNHPVLVSTLKRIHRRSNAYYEKSKYEWVVTNTEWKSAGRVRRGDWVQLPNNALGHRPPVINFTFGNEKRRIRAVVNEEIAWLLGLYVADGHTSCPNGLGGKGVISLGAHEQRKAIRAVKTLRSIGVVAGHRLNKAGNVIMVTFSTKGLATLLGEWCGKGALRKVIPQQIKDAPRRIIRAFISGLVDGDGCTRHSPPPKGSRGICEYTSVSTISRQLAYDILEVMHSIGVHTSVCNPTIRTDGVIRGRKLNSKPFYTIHWSTRAWLNKASNNGRAVFGCAKFIKNKVYLQVTRTSSTSVRNLPVFNVETEDNTYCVPFVVHNCTEFVEHVEARFVPNFVETFKHCRFILMTHALPGQGGVHHVNEQPGDYWIAVLLAAGFEHLEDETERLRATYTPDAHYGRNTLMLFKNAKP